MKKLRAIVLLLCMLCVIGACSKQTKQPTISKKDTTQNTTEIKTKQPMTNQANGEKEEPEKMASNLPKQSIVYFANWYLDEKTAEDGGEVASIPWDCVTYINHAFWAVSPSDGSKETSVERRSEEKEARTSFKIISTKAKADYEDTSPSALNKKMQRNHFAQYAAYSEKYPDVNIMISIGGWNDSGYFSEMAYTTQGRCSFIESCMELMDQYPWIDGIDLDWEYPGGSNDGERAPESETDQGCPIWGTKTEDTQNFASLCKEMRSAFDEKYGIGVKKITACASASTGWTLPNQDWVAAEPYLDFINIMTYDLAGRWDGVTGHASSINGAKAAVDFFLARDIKASKLNIGTPFYATGYYIDGEIDKAMVVGAPIKDEAFQGDSYTIKELREFEHEAASGYTTKKDGSKIGMDCEYDNSKVGWHFVYDKEVGGSYMYNDDPKSKYSNWYLSYESQLSLQDKLEFINQYKLAGIIVWECSEDTTDHIMLHQIADNLLSQ